MLDISDLLLWKSFFCVEGMGNDSFKYVGNERAVREAASCLEFQAVRREKLAQTTKKEEKQ